MAGRKNSVQKVTKCHDLNRGRRSEIPLGISEPYKDLSSNPPQQKKTPYGVF